MQSLNHYTTDTIKYCIFLVCLLPFLDLLFLLAIEKLGPDPVAYIIHSTGIWSLRILLIVLFVTPLKKLTRWNWLTRMRRILALYAFFYASLHCLAYLTFEQSFYLPEIFKDISKRPYIIAGFVSYLMMIPLAVTSTNTMMKKMGGKKWQLLHKLAYPVGIGAVLHYFLLVKRDITMPSIYALILLGLFLARMLLSNRRPKTVKVHRLTRTS